MRLRSPASFADIRDELEVPGTFPPDVLAEADRAARRPAGRRVDLRDVDFVTLDPVGARDLDQAYAIERRGDGWTVRYAIADVAHFVDAGGLVDAEARRRGVTYYLPDDRAPLHPEVLSEDAASLLHGAHRPAVVWTIAVGSDGSDGEARLERALIRSREQRDYATAHDPMLQEVGEALEGAEARRGGVSLDLPEQVVVDVGDRFRLEVRAVRPIEGWNEQLSLLAGRSAARLMLDAKVGILRTMPPPDEVVVKHLRRLARAMHIEWPKDSSYAEVVRSIDRSDVRGVVFLRNAVRALRGAGYTAFDGALPELTTHSAVAAPYAHVTAPLRRLADRFANEIVIALCAGAAVPDWARVGLADLAELMEAATRKANEVDRAVIDRVEAQLLTPFVGRALPAIVVSVDPDTIVAVDDPIVIARCSPSPSWSPGDEVSVLVVAADVDARRVELAPA